MTPHEKIFKYFSLFLFFIKKVAQDGERKMEAYKKNYSKHILLTLSNSMSDKDAPPQSMALIKKNIGDKILTKN